MRVYHGDPTKLAAPKPALSLELLALVEKRYGLHVKTPRDLGGSFNLNVLVDGHVLRVYGPWVSAARLEELWRVRRMLRSSGIPIPDVRPTLDGSPWCAFDDCFIEVERYIDGVPMSSWEQLCIGMHTLGQLHTLMADLDVQVPPPIANHLPEAHVLAATLDATAVVRAWGPTPQEERYAAIAETLARMLPVMDLPCQPVHGDFKDTNVLFRDTDLVAVLDFDFMGVRPRIDDLALPLHCLLQTGTRLTDVRGLVDAYDSGCATPLSDLERRALPFALARMSLSYLQYLTLPGDEPYMLRCRLEFNERRGPACEWWLRTMRGTARWEGAFA
ncbi:MAG: phosphotransferase enzyme family protein [Promethearchaeota archaeon]